MIHLVVGLGNPGIQYCDTRHNVGWSVIDNLPFAQELIWKEKFKGLFASWKIQGEIVYFLKPMTYMNLSGESVLRLSQFFKISLLNTLVIHDEIDLPYGQIAFKKGGGLAGHNGLKSIAASFADQNFYRMRIGVSRPTHGDVASWVLGKFSPEEEVTLSDYTQGCAKALVLCLNQGPEKAATLYSRKFIVNGNEKS